MGYDLHITRAEFWPESDGCSITETEWHSLADKVDGLEVRGSTYLLRLPTGIEILMWWRYGQITINKPFGGNQAENGMITDALADLAAHASARLVGDDGETYEGTRRRKASASSSRTLITSARQVRGLTDRISDLNHLGHTYRRPPTRPNADTGL